MNVAGLESPSTEVASGWEQSWGGTRTLAAGWDGKPMVGEGRTEHTAGEPTRACRWAAGLTTVGPGKGWGCRAHSWWAMNVYRATGRADRAPNACRAAFGAPGAATCRGLEQQWQVAREKSPKERLAPPPNLPWSRKLLFRRFNCILNRDSSSSFLHT